MDGTSTSSGSIGITIGILLFLITTLTIASYFCTRACSSPPRQSRDLYGTTHHQLSVSDNEVGLDEAILMSYPTLLYSQAKIHNKDITSSCCSICLADYKDTDMLRLLPDCNHIFHVKCVDAWLRLHPTCPVCRTSPLPTPLAEVVPLASRV
ncbi:RING-H2 finger protein ATL70-like [Magnolia sinica]|uniref:RING-H2 finger protein ATL70-like n=1 Tax=Magnolia sinica TaxID=86752 RepID=UPI002658D247|nr:RING-H2 finger protein ATL70-like [Magnolia sinica]